MSCGSFGRAICILERRESDLPVSVSHLPALWFSLCRLQQCSQSILNSPFVNAFGSTPPFRTHPCPLRSDRLGSSRKNADFIFNSSYRPTPQSSPTSSADTSTLTLSLRSSVPSLIVFWVNRSSMPRERTTAGWRTRSLDHLRAFSVLFSISSQFARDRAGNRELGAAERCGEAGLIS